MMNKLLDFCSDIGIDYLKNAPISEYLTFKVGGPCRAMLFPDTVDKLVEALKYIRDNDIKHYGKKIGVGVYCSPKPDVFENMTEEIEGNVSNFKIGFINYIKIAFNSIISH